MAQKRQCLEPVWRQGASHNDTLLGLQDTTDHVDMQPEHQDMASGTRGTSVREDVTGNEEVLPTRSEAWIQKHSKATVQELLTPQTKSANHIFDTNEPLHQTSESLRSGGTCCEVVELANNLIAN